MLEVQVDVTRRGGEVVYLGKHQVAVLVFLGTCVVLAALVLLNREARIRVFHPTGVVGMYADMALLRGVVERRGVIQRIEVGRGICLLRREEAVGTRRLVVCGVAHVGSSFAVRSENIDSDFLALVE